MRFRSLIGEVGGSGSGVTAGSGDWVAAFNADNYVVGRAPVSVGNAFGCTNVPIFSLTIYAEDNIGNTPDGFCPPPPYGMADGEAVLVILWDSDTDRYFQLGTGFVFDAGNQSFGFQNGQDCTNDLETFPTEVPEPSNILPVTFSSLSARDLGGKVAIDWSTASESGNEYFEVEHSNRLGGFVALGRIEGAGESQQLLSYDFIHDNPVRGTNYYRIKQVDFEGTFSYSGIVPITVAVTQAAKVNIFPNPSTGFFNLNVGSGWDVDNVSVSVMNTVGRRVMEWNQDVVATRQVVTTDLAAGIYLVRVEGGKRSTTQRLIVK